MTNNCDCPICEAGSLQDSQEFIEVNYRGQTELRASSFSVCDACGIEQTSAAQARANKRDTIAFRKSVDGLLTGAEVKSVRDRLGISQNRAAQLFGGGPVAFSKYENDDVAQSSSMNKLMRLADEVPSAYFKLVEWADETGGAADNVPTANDDHWVNVKMTTLSRAGGNLRLVSSRPIPTEEPKWEDVVELRVANR